MKKRYFAILAVAFSMSGAFAQDNHWEVPEDKAERLAPEAFTDAMRKAGEETFKANCMSCHGTPGQANFVPLNPSPGDPAEEKFAKDLDGELLYKIQEGRGAMPSFKASLSTSQIWEVIAYFRSFHKDYVQEVAEEIIRSGLSGGKVVVKMGYNEEKHRIEALITEVKPEETKPISGAEVKIFAQRKFGELPLGETKQTDNNGMVWFASPEELPGDSIGNVAITLKLADEEAFGEVKESATFKLGVPTHKPSLREKRALWNTVQKAPLWILFIYIGGVLGVWSVIFFIAFQIRKIYLIGKEE